MTGGSIDALWLWAVLGAVLILVVYHVVRARRHGLRRREERLAREAYDKGAAGARERRLAERASKRGEQS